MGCDIHAYLEVKDEEGKWCCEGEVLETTRSYGLFGFLANVRNYSHVPVIAQPRGLPEDIAYRTADAYEQWDNDAHTPSWLSVKELLDYDYDQVFWDRRVVKQTGPNSWSGAALAEEGEGEHPTLRAFLGDWWFEMVSNWGAYHADPSCVRIVFWFDN